MEKYFNIVFIVIILFTTFLFHNSGFCAVMVEWDYNSAIHPNDLIKTSDGGFIVLADSNAYLIKLDSFGNEIWKKSYLSGIPNIDVIFSNGSVTETQDGGFVAVGYQRNGATADYLLFILKTDSDGNEIWRKIFYGSDGYIFGRSVYETKSGDLVVTGLDSFHSSGNVYGGGTYLLKLDADGNEIWIRYYENDARAIDVRETMDGGFILTGSVHLENYSIFLHVLKANSDGDMVWSEIFDEYMEGKAVRETDGGNFIIAASGQGNLGAFLVEIDNWGNKLWSKEYDGLDIVESLAIDQSEGYLMVGRANYNLGILKTDYFGNEIWREAIGGYKRGYGICPTDENRYVVYGSLPVQYFVMSFLRADYLDSDNDGFDSDVDCNDNDPSINPDACDIKRDGIDQDCDGQDRTTGKPCVSDDPDDPQVTREKDCSDEIDNDGDELIDCDDPDCSKKKVCRG